MPRLRETAARGVRLSTREYCDVRKEDNAAGVWSVRADYGVGREYGGGLDSPGGQPGVGET